MLRILPSLLIAMLALAPIVDAKQSRSASAKHQFRKANPRPTNSHARGKCPGYVIDHVLPLCAGGRSGVSLNRV